MAHSTPVWCLRRLCGRAGRRALVAEELSELLSGSNEGFCNGLTPSCNERRGLRNGVCNPVRRDMALACQIVACSQTARLAVLNDVAS